MGVSCASCFGGFAEAARRGARRAALACRVAAWRDPTPDYAELGPLIESLEAGKVVLLKGQWLLQEYRARSAWLPWLLGQSRGVLPRRQDLPPEAIWRPEDLIPRLQNKAFRTKIIVLSHCWLSKEHPDPDGAQLSVLGPVLEQWFGYFGAFSWDVAIFMDWCSMFQAPRSPSEEDMYRRALSDVHLWYLNQWTDVWWLTQLPERWRANQNRTPFHDRGWPTFEGTISTMSIKSSGVYGASVLDLGRLQADGANRDWEHIESTCCVGRSALVAPKAFTETLRDKKFCLQEDRCFVEGKYATIFEESAICTTDLFFNGLSLLDEQVCQLAQALPYCICLESLDLASNGFGDVGTAALALVLPDFPRLNSLALDGNSIGSDGAASLAQVLPHCAGLAMLRLDDNCMGDDGAILLAQAAGKCPQLVHFGVCNNGIGETGGKALAESLPSMKGLQKLCISGNRFGSSVFEAFGEHLPKCVQLRHLRIDGCDIGDDGAIPLAQGMSACKNLETAALRQNAFLSRGAEALAEMISSCPHLVALAVECNPWSTESQKVVSSAWRQAVKVDSGLSLGKGSSTIPKSIRCSRLSLRADSDPPFKRDMLRTVSFST